MKTGSNWQLYAEIREDSKYYYQRLPGARFFPVEIRPEEFNMPVIGNSNRYRFSDVELWSKVNNRMVCLTDKTRPDVLLKGRHGDKSQAAFVVKAKHALADKICFDAIPTLAQWVPIAERLPPPLQRVLVISHFDPLEEYWDQRDVIWIGYFDLHGWESDDSAWPFAKEWKVTHWAPLPALPEQEDSL